MYVCMRFVLHLSRDLYTHTKHVHNVYTILCALWNHHHSLKFQSGRDSANRKTYITPARLVQAFRFFRGWTISYLQKIASHHSSTYNCKRTHFCLLCMFRIVREATMDNNHTVKCTVPLRTLHFESQF